MKVQIEENLYIESDTHCFTIKEYTGKYNEKGEELSKTHGYFGTLKMAFKHVLKMKVKQSTATTLKELLKEIKSIEEYIDSQIPV